MKFQDDISNMNTHTHTHACTHARTHTHTRTSRNQYVPHFFKVGGIRRGECRCKGVRFDPKPSKLEKKTKKKKKVKKKKCGLSGI